LIKKLDLMILGEAGIGIGIGIALATPLGGLTIHMIVITPHL